MILFYGRKFIFLILSLFLLGCAPVFKDSISSHTSTIEIEYTTQPKFIPPEDAWGFYGRERCELEDYYCIKINPGDTWESLFPNPREREIVMRLNRMNTPVSQRPWILIPHNLSSIAYKDISPFPLNFNTNGEKLLLIDLREQAFAAYDPHGELIHWGPISAGKGMCSDGENCQTVTGQFRIFRKQGENCKSSKYPRRTKGGSPMPYCMFYYRGWAIHGAPLPGHHNSHGCIRLFYEDARWLNEFFIKIGTPVEVRA